MLPTQNFIESNMEDGIRGIVLAEKSAELMKNLGGTPLECKTAYIISKINTIMRETISKGSKNVSGQRQEIINLIDIHNKDIIDTLEWFDNPAIEERYKTKYWYVLHKVEYTILDNEDNCDEVSYAEMLATLMQKYGSGSNKVNTAKKIIMLLEEYENRPKNMDWRVALIGPRSQTGYIDGFCKSLIESVKNSLPDGANITFATTDGPGFNKAFKSCIKTTDYDYKFFDADWDNGQSQGLSNGQIAYNRNMSVINWLNETKNNMCLIVWDPSDALLTKFLKQAYENNVIIVLYEMDKAQFTSEITYISSLIEN